MKKILTLTLSLVFSSLLIVSTQASEKGSMKGSEKGSEKGSSSYMMKEKKQGSPAAMNGGMDGSSKGTLHSHNHTHGHPSIPPEAVTASGMAKITGTGAPESADISGNALVKETDDGLYVEISLNGVPGAGKHGIHIHQKGSCEDGGKGAGGHYNPAKTKHGYYPKDGFEHSHPGDMGNILISKDGSGHHVAWLPGVSLTNGKYNVAGRAIILHVKEDDFGQPTGNAGGRIGCGVIYLTQ